MKNTAVCKSIETRKKNSTDQTTFLKVSHVISHRIHISSMFFESSASQDPRAAPAWLTTNSRMTMGVGNNFVEQRIH